MAGRRGYRPPSDYDPRRGKAKKGAQASRRGERGRAASGDPSTPAAGATGRSERRADPRPSAASPAARQPTASPSQLPALEPPAPAKLEATITRPEQVAGLTFADLGLGGNIVRALAELGAAEPYPIQAATVPDALAGHHVLGRARTGSGKTIAFGAALVERLLLLKAEGAFADEAPRAKPKRGERQARPTRGTTRAPKALILAPTRELALQIDRTVQPIARSVGLYTGQFVGGQPFEPQLHALQRGVDIAIGTPGRIEDLAKRGHLALGRVAITVIDEADHMAELGFIEPVQRILRQTRRGGQRLLFSATLDRGVDGVVAEFMPRPAVHEVMGQGTDDSGVDLPEGVEHRVLIVLREHKDDVLAQWASTGERTIVFCRTRAYAERIAELLVGAEVRAVALHGDLSQARRERNLAKLEEGRVEVLVATDIAARGIHVDDVALVVQADPPDDAKAYVHRAGRTGRAGSSGRVVTVIPRTRQKRTRELFAQLGIEPTSFADFEPGQQI